MAVLCSLVMRPSASLGERLKGAVPSVGRVWLELTLGRWRLNALPWDAVSVVSPSSLQIVGEAYPASAANLVMVHLPP